MGTRLRTLSVPEAAEVLGLGVHAVYRAVPERRLPVLRSGRKIRVPVAVLDDLLRNPARFTAPASHDKRRPEQASGH